jgi:hypothetical protein
MIHKIAALVDLCNKEPNLLMMPSLTERYDITAFISGV